MPFLSWHSIPVNLLRSGQTSPTVLSCQCTILTPDCIRVAEKGRTESTLYHAKITEKAGCNYHFYFHGFFLLFNFIKPPPVVIRRASSAAANLYYVLRFYYYCILDNFHAIHIRNHNQLMNRTGYLSHYQHFQTRQTSLFFLLFSCVLYQC